MFVLGILMAYSADLALLISSGSKMSVSGVKISHLTAQHVMFNQLGARLVSHLLFFNKTIHVSVPMEIRTTEQHVSP